MEAVSGADPALARQCLELCQALITKGMAFSLSMTVGPTITFTLDTKVKEDNPSPKARKRPSPSTVKRNARRKAEYLERWQQPPKAPGTPSSAPSPAAPGSWRCSESSSAGLKLTRKPKSVILQLDGSEEIPNEPDAEKKDQAVQTMKEVPVHTSASKDQLSIRQELLLPQLLTCV